MIDAFEPVLADVDAQGRAKFGKHWMERVAEALKSLETAYPTLTDDGREPIDYSELPTQAAYVYAYALPRAAFTYEFLKRHREAIGQPLFDGTHLVVVSFGGGPASELVGLVRYLDDEEFGESVETIEFQVFDKNGEWEATTRTVIENIPTNIEVDVKYHELDLADSDQVAKIDLSETDLVILSYIISELCALEAKDTIQINMQSVFAGIKSGAKMLFIESKHPTFIKYFRACKLVSGLRQINDNGDPIDLELPKLTTTYGLFYEYLDRSPRMDGNIVSKLIKRA